MLFGGPRIAFDFLGGMGEGGRGPMMKMDMDMRQVREIKGIVTLVGIVK